jgi:soluble lytic murein transglycosylase
LKNCPNTKITVQHIEMNVLPLKHVLFIWTVLLILLPSCSAEVPEGLATARKGFYDNSRNIIAHFEKRKNLKPHQHFLLAYHLEKTKQFSKALTHYTASAFTSFTLTDNFLLPDNILKIFSKGKKRSPWYYDSLYHIIKILHSSSQYEKSLTFFRQMDIEKDDPLYLLAALEAGKSFNRLQRFNESERLLSSLLVNHYSHGTEYTIKIRRASVYEKENLISRAVDEYVNIVKMSPHRWQRKIALTSLYRLKEESLHRLPLSYLLVMAKEFAAQGEYQKAHSVLTTMKNQGARCLEFQKLHLRMVIRRSRGRTLPAIEKGNPFYHDLCLCAGDELSAIGKQSSAKQYYLKGSLSSDKTLSHNVSMKLAFLKIHRKSLTGNMVKKLIKKFPHNKKTGDLTGTFLVKTIKDRSLVTYTAIARDYIKLFPEDRNISRIAYGLYRLDDRGKRGVETAGNIYMLNPGSVYSWLVVKDLKSRLSHKETMARFNHALNNKNYAEARVTHTLLFLYEKSIGKRNARVKKLQRSFSGRIYWNVIEDTSDKRYIQAVKRYLASGTPSLLHEYRRLLAYQPQGSELIHHALIARKYSHWYESARTLLRAMRKNHIDEDISLLDETFLSILYPKAYERCILSNSKKFHLDRNLLWSIIKAESYFNHQAVSHVGAKGLMQLMPSTARETAKKLKLKSYDVTSPCSSLQLGSKYLSWLSKRFNGNRMLILAGYNAGPGNVKRWTSNNTVNDLWHFSEIIPYNETRRYILKIEKYHNIYSLLEEAGIR